MRKLIIILLLGGLVATGSGAAQAGAPKTVWEDEAGDADAAQGLGASIPGGFDLASGSIAKNGANLDFTVTHHDMPPSGSVQEGFRFLWAFSAGDKQFRITAKSADIGKPDVLAGQTTDRVGEVSPLGHFRLEGNCETGETIGVLQPINCEDLERLEGTFDAASKSFTVSIPMASIGAKTKTLIQGGAGDATAICQICWVTHVAERSLNSTIVDSAAMTGAYKVPKK
jgi:hypothetical protein